MPRIAFLDPGSRDSGLYGPFLTGMKELGYTKQPFPPKNWNGSFEYSAVFANGREELVVSIQQEPMGTAVVFNRISALERLQ